MEDLFNKLNPKDANLIKIAIVGFGWLCIVIIMLQSIFGFVVLAFYSLVILAFCKLTSPNKTEEEVYNNNEVRVKRPSGKRKSVKEKKKIKYSDFLKKEE